MQVQLACTSVANKPDTATLTPSKEDPGIVTVPGFFASVTFAGAGLSVIPATVPGQSRATGRLITLGAHISAYRVTGGGKTSTQVQATGLDFQVIKSGSAIQANGNLCRSLW